MRKCQGRSRRRGGGDEGKVGGSHESVHGYIRTRGRRLRLYICSNDNATLSACLIDAARRNLQRLKNMAPLVVLTIVFGIYPKPVLDVSATSVTQLIDNFHHAVSSVQSAELAR